MSGPISFRPSCIRVPITAATPCLEPRLKCEGNARREVRAHPSPSPTKNGLSYSIADKQTIDLSGWELKKAVDFVFPAGTQLAAGEYLVVARDEDALRVKYPDIQIAGEFSGTLGNSSDHIVLLDANHNPADEVEYFERGQWAEYADGGGSSLELRDPFPIIRKGPPGQQAMKPPSPNGHSSLSVR